MDNDPSVSGQPQTAPRALVPVEVAQPGAVEDEEFVSQPAKLMRIASMAKQLLEEVRMAPLDDASRARMKEIYQESVRQLEATLSPELAAELDRLAIPFDDGAPPSDAEPPGRPGPARRVAIRSFPGHSSDALCSTGGHPATTRADARRGAVAGSRKWAGRRRGADALPVSRAPVGASAAPSAGREDPRRGQGTRWAGRLRACRWPGRLSGR